MINKKLLFLIALGAIVFVSGCLSSNNYNLTILTVDNYGNPIGNVDITLYSRYELSSFDGIKWSTISGSIDSKIETDKDGKATIQLSKNKYAISAWKSDYSFNGDEVLLDGDKEIQIKLYPIQRVTLKEKLDGETYEVQQTLFMSEDAIEWYFNPEIKFFEDTGEDDDVYMVGGYGNIKMPIKQIAKGSFTIINEDTGEEHTFNDGEVYNGGTVRISTNDFGMYSFGFRRE